MTPGVQKALMAVDIAAKADGAGIWFLAIRDPDSMDRHCHIYGGMEAGFHVAHISLAGQGRPLHKRVVPALWKTLAGDMEEAGIQTWYFACLSDTDGDMPMVAYRSNTLPSEAFGLGVTCLHMMIAGHIGGHLNFTLGTPGGDLPPPPLPKDD